MYSLARIRVERAGQCDDTLTTVLLCILVVVRLREPIRVPRACADMGRRRFVKVCRVTFCALPARVGSVGGGGARVHHGRLCEYCIESCE